MSLRNSRGVAVALVTLATFTDLVAYSICVPVLPDFARQLGASATMIGLLFASFGLTLVVVGVPLGAASDRVGRRIPLVGGMLALAGSTAAFAVADTLPRLFTARLIQGAADGVTWVAGLALVADLYGPDDRGRVMGYVMSGTSVGIIVGPSIGGWLYQTGGVGLPFAFASALSLACAVGFAWMRPAAMPSARPRQSIWSVARAPAVARCIVAVVLTGATIAMLEPVLSLFFDGALFLGPADIGLLFGAAAVAGAVMPFVYGPMTDRWGGRRLTLVGLVLTSLWMPMMAASTGFPSALAIIVVLWIAIALIITPSLAYMAEVTASAGGDAYGVGYGLYNTAWGVGLLGGPALGGWLFDRLDFAALMISWSLGVLIVTLVLVNVRLKPDATSARRSAS